MDAHKLLSETETVYEQTADYLRDGARLLHDTEGELFTLPEAIDLFETELGLTESVARKVLTQLVGDSVDPVIQVVDDGTKYIGVAEFHTFDGVYGYVGYDSVYGKEKRVVCQQCVNESRTDESVTCLADTELRGPSSPDGDWQALVASLHDHYEQSHSVSPASVESSVDATGAVLKSETKIGGFKAVHDGREGEIPIKAANAAKVGGRSPDGTGGVARDEQLYTDTEVLAVLDQNTDLQLGDSSLVSGTSVSDPVVSAQIKATNSQQLQGKTPASDGSDIATTNEIRTDSEIQTAVDGSDAQYTDEQAQDAVGDIVTNGLNYNDSSDLIEILAGAALSIENGNIDVTTGNALTIDGNNNIAVSESNIALDNLTGDTDNIAEGGNLYFTDERAQDAVGNTVGGGLNYNDSSNLIEILAGNALTIDGNGNIDVVESNISHDNISGVSSGDHHSRYADSEARTAVDGSSVSLNHDNLTGVSTADHHSRYSDEEVEDTVDGLLVGGSNITLAYDDSNGTLSIDGTPGYSDEQAQDAVGSILGGLFNYDDSGPAITLSIGDDETLTFGTGNDLSLRYPGAADSLRLRDETNETDRFEVDRTSGNINTTGELTENTSL